ncbi:acetyltransferase [Bacillus sp. FJAT-27264]|uniref:GNAT family N-acetyltransferase n=1 Tax=Paenibacillus sp. (strain DSM 101736 / FJAT-27264) TaxID=1850362 RepID=UPI000807D1F3|nr:acetyltransferase [Bacillus sp. FJAT-27264]
MSHLSIDRLQDVEIRNFQEADMPLLEELFRSVTAKEHAVFWWVGEPANWGNVLCAFKQGVMIAKGQVSIINMVPPGSLSEARHSIYMNLKAVPEWEHDFELMDHLYMQLYARALELKETLPSGYSTLLCVGNDSGEVANNQFFKERHSFRHLNSLFSMNRDLGFPLPELTLPAGLEMKQWQMATVQEEEDYLTLEAEIWPDTPLGSNRLAEYKRNDLWTALVVREGEIIVGSLMVWREDNYGYIEDVFVREPWRKRGVAKYLLTQAMKYSGSHGLLSVRLMVLTTNPSALKLYESLGFTAIQEEIRFCLDLE